MQMTWLCLACLILTIIDLTSAAASCPSEDLVSPCLCENDGTKRLRILCNGNKSIDLQAVFDSLSEGLSLEQRHFDELELENEWIEVLPYNITGMITFGLVSLQAPNITRIHSQAFAETAHTVKTLFLGPKMIKYKNRQRPFDWFDFINSFSNLEMLIISIPNFSVVPEDAFKKLVHLKVVDISVNEIRKYPGYPALKKRLVIQDNAFYSLGKLNAIVLPFDRINKVTKKMFNIRENSTVHLDLYMPSNQLSAKSFHVGSLVNFNRPTNITLNGNRIDYLNENVFRPFLDAHKNNTISTLYIKCMDRKNSWWIDPESKYYDRVYDPSCGKHRQKTFDPDYGD